MWARSIVDRSYQYYILDTETTGLDNPEVIELAVINLAGQMIVNQRYNPITPISTGATDIHGMTNEGLSAKPKWKVGIDCLERVIFQRKLLIYNYTFDRRAIRITYDLHNIRPPVIEGECVMHWYAQFCGDWDNRRRSYRWQKLPGGDHSALGDCIATLEIIKLMARSLIVEDLIPDRPSQIAPDPIGNQEKIAS
jgi:DNA polymerase III subunit epsilon